MTEEPIVRRNDRGGILVWTAYDRETGAPIQVDDRTFDEAMHSREVPGAAKPKGKKSAPEGD